MKIIDLLKEKQELMSTLRKNEVYGYPQVVDGTTDEERKKFREFQQKAKRFNEICDAVHTAYSQTRVSVPFYGDISLATAVEYFVGECDTDDWGNSITEHLLINNCNFLDEANTVVKSHIFSEDESEDDIFNNPLSMGMMRNRSTQPKKRDYDREFWANSYTELKVAIMKAIAETDV